MIHVCFGLHDATGRYSKFTGTTILSIFENTAAEVTVHILHDKTLTTDNRKKFILLAEHYNQRVNFYNVEVLCADKINEFKQLLPFAKDSTRTIGMFFRFLIGEILPQTKKIIYLDSDIIVNLDVKTLWQTELGDKILAVVPEMQSYVPTNKLHYLCREGFVKSEEFFNSGVLLVNLDEFRLAKDILKRGIKFRIEHPDCDGNDQSILNYCFSTQTVQLPLKFNVLVEYARMNNDFETEDRICHYITSSRGEGIGLDATDPFNRLWMEYFIKTPWFDNGTIGRLYADVRQMHSELKNSMIKISALMSGKTRAFFIPADFIDAIKDVFYVRDDEEIISAEDKESLKKLLHAMNFSRGKKVFFIVVPNFPFAILTQFGFVASKDFVDGFDFLSEVHGVPLNSYPLIKAM